MGFYEKGRPRRHRTGATTVDSKILEAHRDWISKQIRHWDEGYHVIGTNYLQIGHRIKKEEAGNAPCSLRPKTEPCPVGIKKDSN